MKSSDDFAQLTDINPGHDIRQFLDRPRGLSAMGDRDEGHSFVLGLFGKDQRKLAVSSNQSDLSHQ
jgi:hypothetical protein